MQSVVLTWQTRRRLLWFAEYSLSSQEGCFEEAKAIVETVGHCPSSLRVLAVQVLLRIHAGQTLIAGVYAVWELGESSNLPPSGRA